MKEYLTDQTGSRCKTETRRVINLKGFRQCEESDDLTFLWTNRKGEEVKSNWAEVIKMARYQMNETVYIKEPYIEENGKFKYKYNMTWEERQGIKWKNKLFMPAAAARLKVVITGILLERLQDISAESVEAEGLKVGEKYSTFGKAKVKYLPHLKDWAQACYPTGLTDDHKLSFKSIIDRINGKGTWEANPWVYVYSYSLLS